MAGMPQLPHDGLLSATPQGQGLPGLGGCVGLAACRDPQRTFEALGGGNSADEDAEDAGGSTAACADHIISMRAEGTRRGVGSDGVELEQWLRMAPLMGLADVVTAGTTFAMLAEPPQTASASVAAIPFRTFAKYVERVGAKCTPGAELVGGIGSSATADELLSEAVAQHYHAAQRGAGQGLFRQGFAESGGGAVAEFGERVLIAAGMPAYAVQDMASTPRTNGTLLLTTHALWWRPAGLRTLFKSAPRWRRYGLMLPRSAATEDTQWGAEACLAGPFGLGVMDTALRLRAVAGGGGGRTRRSRMGASSSTFLCTRSTGTRSSLPSPRCRRHMPSPPPTAWATVTTATVAAAAAAGPRAGARARGGGALALPATVTWALLGATVRLRVRAAVQPAAAAAAAAAAPRALAARPRARSVGCFDWDPQPPRRCLCARSGRS
eukprot:COSAG01_NODE_205_length_22070_cov_106.423877_4_plen_438_part_00